MWVRRQWNDYRTAKYRLDAIEGVHWDSISGGVNAVAIRPFLHAYVWCDAMLEGELAHSCAHGKGPHRIKVCIVKKDNDPDVFAQLVAQSGSQPETEKRKPTFWQWLKLKDQLARTDAVGDFARQLAAKPDNRPGRNTFEAWKRCLGAKKGSPAYKTLSQVWHEYSKLDEGAT